MSRLEPLTRDQMNDEQKRVYDEISAKGGRLSGPYAAYIRIPRFMELNHAMGDYLRSNSLPERQRYLIVLITVRHHGAAFAWGVHSKGALEAGIEKPFIEAINRGEHPNFHDTGDAMTYKLVKEILTTGGLSDNSFRYGTERFGEEVLADIVVTTGFYTMVSMTLNSYDIQPPDDVPFPIQK